MFARTRRLTLRPGWPEEAEALYHAIAHEAVAMRLARCPWPYTLADAAAFLALPRGAEEPRFLVFAHHGEQLRLIGGVALDRAGNRVAQLGYWLTPAAWGHGYATEAAGMALQIAHALGFTAVEAVHHLDNPASRRVLEKLEFAEVRRGSQPSLARGGAVDCAVMARALP